MAKRKFFADIQLGFDDTRLAFGSGSPESNVAANVSSLFIRQDAADSGQSIYVKDSGTGNTGWTQVAVIPTGASAEQIPFIGSDGNLSTSSDLIWDNSSSSLGINKAVPSSALHVYDNGQFTSRMIFETTNTANAPGVQLQWDSAGTRRVLMRGIAVGTQGSALEFYAKPDSATGATLYATIEANGDLTVETGDIIAPNLTAGTASDIVFYNSTTGRFTYGAAPSGLSGSGLANRVAYWSGSSTLTSISNFLFDGSTLTVPSDLTPGNLSITFNADTDTGIQGLRNDQIAIRAGGNPVSVFSYSAGQAQVQISGNTLISDGHLNIDDQFELQLQEDTVNGNAFVALRAGADMTGNGSGSYTLTLPEETPANSQVLRWNSANSDFDWISMPLVLPSDSGASSGDVLTTNGSGALSWTASSGGATTLNALTDVNAPSPVDGQVLTWDNTNTEWIASTPSGGGGSPGGTSGQIQWNNSGAFAGTPLRWDSANTQFVWNSENTGNTALGAMLRVRNQADTQDVAHVWFSDTGWALMGNQNIPDKSARSDFYSLAIPPYPAVLYFTTGVVAMEPQNYAYCNKPIYIGSSANPAGGSLRFTTAQVDFFAAPTSYVEFITPPFSGIQTFTIPTTDGSNGDALVTNGSGVLSFASILPDDSTASSGDVLSTDGAGTFSWITPSSGGGGSGESVQFTITQASPSLALLDSVYHNGTSWQKARADAASTLGTHIVTAVNGSDYTITQAGRVTVSSHGLTAGQYYFTSSTVAGSLTTSEPPLYSNPLVFVESANIIHVLPFRPSLISEAAEYADWVPIWAEENANLSTTVTSGYQFSFGNGGASSTSGLVIPYNFSIMAVSISTRASTTGEVEVYLAPDEGAMAPTGASVTLTNEQSNSNILTTPVDGNAGDMLNFRTVSGSGGAMAVVTAWIKPR